ncbi:MAG TPA: zinc ribbon domain-containing protein [Pyrinomonadaceae bacterium]|nr:zinc ribbon domain-containing protein [Pyrinomonadaceae bacterium]HNU07049.1 zinc ribbon domain-containing protein [Pyrinomonadaceae bacterium]
MPIYEYKCTQCGVHLEKMQKVSDPPLAICEKCGGNLEKQWSLSGFQFKGEGWYVSDYSKKSGGNAPSEKSTQAESTPSGDTASKDTSTSTADKPAKE